MTWPFTDDQAIDRIFRTSISSVLELDLHDETMFHGRYLIHTISVTV